MKMGWNKPSEELLIMLEELVDHIPFERRKMFGQYALFYDGQMFAGVFQDDIFIRLPAEKQKDLMRYNDEVEQFQPLKGRAMREYVTIPESIYSDEDTMKSLINESIAFVKSLPPK
ncbi:MAG: TfoX/Sxy family protein [Candidatus Thorarchaeota archaeon]